MQRNAWIQESAGGRVGTASRKSTFDPTIRRSSSPRFDALTSEVFFLECKERGKGGRFAGVFGWYLKCTDRYSSSFSFIRLQSLENIILVLFTITFVWIFRFISRHSLLSPNGLLAISSPQLPGLLTYRISDSCSHLFSAEVQLNRPMVVYFGQFLSVVCKSLCPNEHLIMPSLVSVDQVWIVRGEFRRKNVW